jgi:glycogen debranching enzyme
LPELSYVPAPIPLDEFALPEGEPQGIEDIRDALVVREGPTFLVTDPDGNVSAGNRFGHGIYHADTRHLSAYRLTLNGVRPVMLLSTAELGYAMEQVMTNPKLTLADGSVVPRGVVEIRRQRVVQGNITETLRLTNFGQRTAELNLMYEIGADFADIFDVRGFKRARFGRTEEPVTQERSVEYVYTGIDGEQRRTRISFDRKPDFLDSATAMFRVKLAQRKSVEMHVTIEVMPAPGVSGASRHFSGDAAEDYQRWFDGCTGIATDNEFFNRLINRSIADVRMLWSRNADGDEFPAAGTPWFDALFGRDSAVLSMQMLAFRPEIAAACLRVLAGRQGERVDPSRDEEPGKILHELRYDELSRAGELPYHAYYGSIDSTPLFLMAIAAYYAWTADLALVRELLPAIKGALHWLDEYGDPVSDGFISYMKHSDKGLVNQGWKDSWDALPHANGRLAKPPISLVEVQGYAYAARTRIAPLLRLLGENALAREAEARAATLRDRFEDAFWIEAERTYALALDGQRRRVETVTTNPSHCLWTGIVRPDRAAQMVLRLMEDDAFSGWGLRTLSDRNPRFNPIGYHMGTVWPHDNSIAAMGFKMYGHEDALNRVATGLFEAATAFPYLRLPELFGGETRTTWTPPVPYPVACNPQSWAAGTMPFITQAILGLDPDAAAGRLRIVNPVLPRFLKRVEVRRLRVGDSEVELCFRREGDTTHVDVLDAGGLQVERAETWSSEPAGVSR